MLLKLRLIGREAWRAAAAAATRPADCASASPLHEPCRYSPVGICEVRVFVHLVEELHTSNRYHMRHTELLQVYVRQLTQLEA